MTDIPVLLQIDGLHVHYADGVDALRGVSLAVSPAERVGLIGPNGAGKTTLMRMICGLAKPDRGEISLGGASLQRAGRELRRYIGLVTHAPLLYDSLSAQENLRFFAALYDLDQPEERIESVLHAVELWARRRDPVRTYSRGMVQRLAIARAVLHSPPGLLLDEPASLDHRSRRRLIETLDGRPEAMLLATHDLPMIQRLCGRVILLDQGRIIADRPTASILGDVAALQLHGLVD